MRGCGLPGFADSRRLEKVSAAMLQHIFMLTKECEQVVNKCYLKDNIFISDSTLGHIEPKKYTYKF